MIDEFTLPQDAAIRDALAQIDANHEGIIFLTDASGAIVSAATDGDVRRSLLAGASLDDPVSKVGNVDFVWAEASATREMLLKRLDQRIKVIPVLDAQRRLVGVASRNRLRSPAEERTYARARAPVRVSFSGGGSDLTHYFADHPGAVLNSAVSLYSHATLRIRDDSRVSIASQDLGRYVEEPDLATFVARTDEFRLIAALVKLIDPGFGFDLAINSDFPVGSGLGGSAVVSAAVLGCFNQFRRDQWDLHELAELAFQAERVHLGISGGWQDQYATVFGGFNFMEFGMDQNIVHPLRIPPAVLLELEESLILCDTQLVHDSGNIHDSQREEMSQAAIRAHVKANVELTYRMRNHLLRGKLLEFGRGLHEGWMLKRQVSRKISSAMIDSHYELATRAGAVGGKLLGAGGGGFFLFYAPPFAKMALVQALQEAGLRVVPFRFEPDGLRAWSARERQNMPLHLEGSNVTPELA